MKKTFFLISIFCSTQFILSQAPSSFPTLNVANKFTSFTSNYEELSFTRNFKNNVKTLNPNEFFVNGRIVNAENLDGSIYWSENFKKGKIIDNKDEAVVDVYLRYRILDDKFEIKSDLNDSKLYTLERSNRYDLMIDNTVFTFLTDLPIKINGANNGYSIVMVVPETDKAGLYKRISQEFVPGKKSVNPLKPDEEAELEKNVTYFLEFNSATRVIEPNKRKAAEAFPNHREEIEVFIDEQDLKFKDDHVEEDLIRLVNYYNKIR